MKRFIAATRVRLIRRIVARCETEHRSYGLPFLDGAVGIDDPPMGRDGDVRRGEPIVSACNSREKHAKRANIMRRPATFVRALLLGAGVFAMPAVAQIAGPLTNPANGHLYYLLAPDSWTNSQAQAVALGGNLVKIDDAAENSWVHTTFVPLVSGGRDQGNLWIGLSDQANEGSFVWTDGSTPSYTNWTLGEPSDSNNVEDFAHMVGRGFANHPPLQWNDMPDSVPGGGVVSSPYGVVEVDGGPAEYTEFGQGCPGTNELVPHLTPAEGSRPFLGTTITLNLTNLPTFPVAVAHVPFMVLSFTQFGPPPLDLGFVGMPGCELSLDAPFLVFTLNNVGGTASWSALTIPLDPSFVGFEFFCQGAVFDEDANAQGVVVSNAVKGVIG